MFNRDNIDFKLILSFTNAYKRLNEKGKISDQEMEEVLSLLDNYKKYSHQEFKEKLEEIAAATRARKFS
jgi:hypothetical protein